MAYDGGYLMIKRPLVRSGLFEHTSAVPNAVPAFMLRAINEIQRVPWRINTFILDVMREAFVNCDTIGDLPSPDPIPLPPRLPDSEWKRMSKTERAGYKVKLSDIHSENARASAQVRAALRKLHVAEELRNETAIWFPHSIDFRGRIYPIPQDVNPQSDDLSKALLMFADGRRVTERGIWWLAIGVANAFGQDKLTFNERFDWTVSNLKLIEDSVKRPLDGERFWTTAESPWTALALCREFSEAWTQGEDAISHIPVNVDGSCNGLQHLAAWGLDPVGAKATNLCDSSVKQDLYSEVAREVIRITQRDALTIPEAAHWIGKVDRKTVKRAVMTTPYGVTHRGIQNQLIEDRMVIGVPGNPLKNAEYLKNAIVEALETTVKSAKEIMGYIQGCAKALAEASLPLRWDTPVGMKVEQAYMKKNKKRIVTLIGQLDIWKDNEDLGLQVRKQILASAPNVIHSFDAAHLARTVVSCVEDRHIRAFTFVHDSYGTHAGSVDAMREVLRDEFVEMYREDPTEKFERGIKAYAPHVDLPERPKRGTFDLNEVRRSPYFFS